MCLILFAWHVHPDFPLIVAANRDEIHARPAAASAFWPDFPQVLAGRDLEQGGTWLGLTRTLRFAAVTNYRHGYTAPPKPRSRGELTRNYLTGTEQPLTYLRSVEQQGHLYNGFSLLAGNIHELHFLSNRAAGVRTVEPGVHGLSNHLLDEPWPKVIQGRAVLETLLHAQETELTGRLFEMLSDRSAYQESLAAVQPGGATERRHLAPIFISAESYGTRASTVILVPRDGGIVFSERCYGPHGTALGSSTHRFRSGAVHTTPAADPTGLTA